MLHFFIVSHYYWQHRLIFPILCVRWLDQYILYVARASSVFSDHISHTKHVSDHFCLTSFLRSSCKISWKLLGHSDWGLTLSGTIFQSYWAEMAVTVEKCCVTPVRVHHWLKSSSYWPAWKEWAHFRCGQSGKNCDGDTGPLETAGVCVYLSYLERLAYHVTLGCSWLTRLTQQQEVLSLCHKTDKISRQHESFESLMNLLLIIVFLSCQNVFRMKASLLISDCRYFSWRYTLSLAGSLIAFEVHCF